MSREVFKLRTDQAKIRCPLCGGPCMGVTGVKEYRLFPEPFMPDPFGSDIRIGPPPAVRQFRATFAPCGCIWEGANRNGRLPYVLLIEVNDDAVERFSIIDREASGYTHAMYIIRATERTDDA